MFFTPSSLLFLSSIVGSIILVASAPSLLISWVGLELNTLAFIPLMLMVKGKLESESAIKYFLTQTLASVMFLMGSVLMDFSTLLAPVPSLILLLALCIKLGAAPFHAWVPGLIFGLNWPTLFLLLSIQKINPLIILTMCPFLYPLLSKIILASLSIGAIMGLAHSQTPMLMAFSSINHMGWMLTAATLHTKILFFYFSFYLILLGSVIIILSQFNLFHLNQAASLNLTSEQTLVLSVTLLSLGGLPPFLGFLPKWLVLTVLAQTQSSLISLSLIMFSLLTLFYYLRLTYASFVLAKNFSFFSSISEGWPLSGLQTSLLMISMVGFSFVCFI